MIGISGFRDRIERQFGRRIHGERHAVVAWVIDRLLHFEVQLLTAGRLADHVAGFSPVRVSSAAGATLLGVATLTFDKP